MFEMNLLDYAKTLFVAAMKYRADSSDYQVKLKNLLSNVDTPLHRMGQGLKDIQDNLESMQMKSDQRVC